MTEYRDAFADMWNNVLVEMPNGIEDIAPTLEREFLLRRFNKDFLEMEINSGSEIRKIIGMGERIDKDTGRTDKVVNFYPTYFRNVLKVFEDYPVYKHFGITIKDAMALPFDEWKAIEKASIDLMATQPPDTEAQLLQIIKGLTAPSEEG